MKLFVLGVLFYFIPTAFSCDCLFSYVKAAEGYRFDSWRVLHVKVEMEPRRWDSLRSQTRSVQQGPWGLGCFAEPVPTPYTYFSARVDIDGDVLEDVAVRKKGMYGSLDDKRPSLKLNFSKFKKGRRWKGLKKLTLNNSLQDPSLVRQCLGYELFRRAGVVTPRCNFASVMINDVSLGIYVNVESIDKIFLKGELGKKASCLEEGAATDFRPGWVRSFDHKYGNKQVCRRDLNSLVELFLSVDYRIVHDVKKILDLDSFFSLWALESLLGDDDGYTSAANNYFVAKGGDGLWHFIPWGIDEIMAYPSGVRELEPCEPFCRFVRTYSIVPLRLWLIPAMRRQYMQRLGSLMDGLWNEDRLLARVDEMEKTIWPYLTDGQARALPKAVQSLESFICSRRELFEMEMQMGQYAVRPFLADPPCDASQAGAVTSEY